MILTTQPSFPETTSQIFEVLNLTDQAPEELWNELKEVVKDEYQTTLPKIKKWKKDVRTNC